MDFIFPWKSDINFKSYINEHQNFVGREWIIEDISYELIHTDHRGLLIAAELGFGKSALISHIACSYERITPAFPIFEKTVGIHLCRYDSNLTLNPGFFVRNIAGKLSETVPEFGNILNTESMASEYLTNSKCNQDPSGCFDQIILYPLRKTSMNQNSLVIIIDALDECIENGPYNIFSLLCQKIHQLPPNVKFLFTSRNISSVRVNLPPGISLYQTPFFEEKNLGDIKRYIIQRLETTSVGGQFQTLLNTSKLDESVEKLTELVNGNFLFLIHAIDFWLKIGDVSAFPDDMEHIYRLNVKRIFGKIENMFEDVRSIFEILCASRGSINETLLYEILKVDSSTKKIYISRLLSNELSHFVHRLSGKIVFTNKRVADFFSKQNNIENDFYILQQNGHKLISEFFITNLENYAIKITPMILNEILRHVTSSKNDSLMDRLNNIVRVRLNEHEYVFFKHYIAATINSYETMLYAIVSTSHLGVDARDPGNLTASFIAAAYGNNNVLAALIDNGADVHYVRPLPVFIHIIPAPDPVQFCKYNTFCGYNLANIASQNGHADVLKLLLKHNIDPCHENSLGLNSFHLAAEHGHLEILQILLSSQLCNFTSSLNNALYLAARNGKVDVVMYLISLNAIDTCVPCLGSTKLILKEKVRLKPNVSIPFLPYEIDYRNFVLNDDRHLHFCETALDIAVQKNYLQVVKVLVNETENALKCINARGMTPVITAVMFQSDDVLRYFLQLGLPFNDTCKVKRALKHRFSNNVGDLIDDRLCQNELSFWHMMAHYSSPNIIDYVIKLPKYKYIWNLKDVNGATTLHHACCNSKIHLDYDFLLILNSHMLDRTLNGLTPAHTAALCGNVVPIYIFMKYLKLPLDIKDWAKKNILHFFAKSSVDDIPYFQQLLSEIIKNSYDKLISEQDSEGKTPLHYAATSGKTILIRNDILNNTFKPNHYMIRDKFNMSVLDVLFKYMPSVQPKLGKFVLKLPPNDCYSDDLFLTQRCSDVRTKLFDDFEAFAFRALTDLRNANLIDENSISLSMHEALKKNRFYLLNMIKALFPKYYQSITKSNVHIFLAQLLKKSSHPSIVLSSTFLPDLMKNACKSKKQYSSLWYILYDSQRKFWQLYLNWNGTQFYDVVYSVLRKCNQRNLIDAATNGGNFYLFKPNDTFKVPHVDFDNYIKLAPCMNIEKKYLTPKLSLKQISGDGKCFEYPNSMPYSHSKVFASILKEHNEEVGYTANCNQYSNKLSSLDILSAKGFLSTFYKIEIEIDFKRKSKHKCLITPIQLAYFFNHSTPYEECINLNDFYGIHFAALFAKVTMDFRSFIFPKHSKAWECFQFVHKMNRMHLKKLVCLASLENEICSLISNLYQIDWQAIFQIYEIDKIKKYVKHEFAHSFDFVRFIQHVRIKCQYRRVKQLFTQVEKYHNASKTINNNCAYVVDTLRSRICLNQIAFLKKQRKYVNYQIQSMLGMYFPLCYLIYHQFIIELPDMARKNTTEIIQILNAFGSVPYFHNNPTYDYWNVLYSPFANPFRTMTQSILSSDIPEIISWIRLSGKENELEMERIKRGEEMLVYFKNPLSVYKNVTTNNSNKN